MGPSSTTILTALTHTCTHVWTQGGGKKKRDPQAEWMDLIGAAAAEVAGGAAASPLVRNNLQRMADLGNVPRNEKKFKNFLGNSLRVRGGWGDGQGAPPCPAWPLIIGTNQLTNTLALVAFVYGTDQPAGRPGRALAVPAEAPRSCDRGQRRCHGRHCDWC